MLARLLASLVGAVLQVYLAVTLAAVCWYLACRAEEVTID
jgi:hypothetical protein